MKKFNLAILASTAMLALFVGCAQTPNSESVGDAAREPSSYDEDYAGFSVQANQAYDGVAMESGNYLPPPPPPPETACDFLVRTGKIDRATSCKTSLRENDIGYAYTVDPAGNFKRWVKNPNKADFIPCQITNQVESFKLSSHPRDVAVAYYARRTNWNNRNEPIKLWHLTDVRDAKGIIQIAGGSCPAVKKPPGPLEANVLAYGVTPPGITNTSIVNYTLGRDHVFRGWPYTTSGGNKVYTEKAVTEFAFNACYDKKGKPFKTYQLFLLKENRQVTKVKGTDSGELSADVSTQGKPFADLEDFRAKNGVTQAICDKK